MSVLSTLVGVQVNVLREMRLFDALPDWIRKIIREADDDVHVEPLARLYVKMRERGLSRQYMAYEIRRACASTSSDLEYTVLAISKLLLDQAQAVARAWKRIVMKQSMIALAASFGFVLGLVHLFEWDCPDEHWILQAVAVDGSVYQTGAGSSCLAAWDVRKHSGISTKSAL